MACISVVIEYIGLDEDKAGMEAKRRKYWAHMHEDDMCRRNNGEVLLVVVSLMTSAANPHAC